MAFIGATKVKHIAADQKKTAFRVLFNAMWSNALTTLTKQRYLTSSGVILKQRHVNKQKDHFSSALQWINIDKKEISYDLFA